MSTPPTPAVLPYIPAPHLLSRSLLTAQQVVSHFQDFYTNLGHIPFVPVFVFERLVANLNEDFIAAIENERLQHAAALEQCHEENKSLQQSNEQLRKDLAESKEIISIAGNQGNISEAPSAGNPTIGVFYINEKESPAQPREIISSVSFATRYSMPPSLVLGFNKLDIGNNADISVKSYPNNIQKDRFDIHIGSSSNSKLHSIGCTWLGVEKNDLDFQLGAFNTSMNGPSEPLISSQTVTFQHPYSAPPRVVVWLSAFHMGQKPVWRLSAYAADITATGFTINIESFYDTVAHSAAASWVAYPDDKPNVLSGRSNTWEIRPPWSSPLCNSAYVNFGNVFAAPPRVLLAINKIDIDHSKNMRLKVKASDVSAAGMTLHIDSWHDTILYGAGVSYIVLG